MSAFTRKCPVLNVFGLIARHYFCLDSLSRFAEGGSVNRGKCLPSRRAPLTLAVRPPTLNPMEVHLTPDQKAFVRQAIESGRLSREEEAVQEALYLWEQRERTRAEILTAVDVAEASVARGEGRAITQESMRQLGDEVKQRGRSRLTSERSSPR